MMSRSLTRGWTDAEDRRLMMAAANDVATELLAERFGRSCASIRQRLAVLTKGEMSAHRVWSKNDIARLRTYLEAGMAPAEIARLLDRSDSAVRNKVAALGLHHFLAGGPGRPGRPRSATVTSPAAEQSELRGKQF